MKIAALDDLNIIELGDFVSAPFCSRLFADLGANVIKIESPYGDSSRRFGPFPDDVPHQEKSGLYLSLNFNKSSITVDLWHPRGRKIVHDLLMDTDILVTNLPLKSLEELELNYASLKNKYSRLIYTCITPFGCTGPYNNWVGNSLTAQALTGIPLQRGEPDREPLAFPAYLSQYETGLAAGIATMYALFSLETTGAGQLVDVSEWQFLATYYNHDTVVTNFPDNRPQPKRRGNRGGTAYPFHVLPCKDGYIYLIAMRSQEWKRMLNMMGDPKWSTNPKFADRVAIGRDHYQEVDDLLKPWLAKRTKMQIFELCRAYQVPFAPIYTAEDLLGDFHLRERGFFTEIPHTQVQSYKFPGAPYQWSKTPWNVRSAAPLLGQQNLEVLSKLGYSKEAARRLRSIGAI